MVFRNLSRPKALLLLPALLVALAAPVLAADDEDAPAAPATDLTGKGGLGFSFGAIRFFGGDLGDGAGVRPILRGNFRYVYSPRIAIALEAGFGWNAYGKGGSYTGPDSVGTLAIVSPLTIGVDYRLNLAHPSVMPRVGAGVGFYPVAVRAGRDVTSRDPVSDHARNQTGPGLYGKGGFEFLLKPSLSLHADFLYHYMLIGDDTKYPSGWLDKNGSFAEVRTGLNYYFTIRQTGAAPRGPSDEEEEE